VLFKAICVPEGKHPGKTGYTAVLREVASDQNLVPHTGEWSLPMPKDTRHRLDAEENPLQIAKTTQESGAGARCEERDISRLRADRRTQERIAGEPVDRTCGEDLGRERAGRYIVAC
jgi:hypothetical protein